jgi:holin-like protein
LNGARGENHKILAKNPALSYYTAMTILKQLSVIFAFCLAGEILARCLPVRLPASVWGLVLLFTAFCVKLYTPAAIGQTADWLMANMGLFFLPPALAIVEQYGILKPAIFRFLIVALVTTVLTLLVTFFTVYLVRRIIQRFFNHG